MHFDIVIVRWTLELRWVDLVPTDCFAFKSNMR